MSLRSFAHTELAISTLDGVHMGSTLLLHSSARPELATSVLDSTHIGLPSPLRSLSCLGLSAFLFGSGKITSVSIFDFLPVGLPLLVRSFARAGPAPSAPDFAHFGLMMLLRSHAQAGPAIPAFDAHHVDLPPLPHSPARTGSGVLAVGTARLGGAPPVLDLLRMGPLLLLRSFSHSDLAPFVSDLAHLGSYSLFEKPWPSWLAGFGHRHLENQRLHLRLRGSASRPLLATPKLWPSGLRTLDPGPLAPRLHPALEGLQSTRASRTSAGPGPPELLVVCCKARHDRGSRLRPLAWPLRGLQHLHRALVLWGSFMPLRSSACLGSAVLALDFGHTDLSTSARSLAAA